MNFSSTPPLCRHLTPKTERERLCILFFAVIIALVSALMFSISAVCLDESAYAKLTPENIKVGKKISGYATISGSYDGAHSFRAGSWSGDLSIIGTRTVTCLNPSAASTPNGRHPYSAKITSIDKNKGKVKASITITPKGASGTARDPQGRLYGYQRAGGTLTFDFSFKGDLVLTKTLSGSSGKSKIKGAKYGIYKTKSDAKKNKNVLAKKTTNSHGQFTTSLTAGTYYIRELSVPWPYLVDEVPRKVVIHGGKKTKLNVKDSKTPKITIKKTITLPNGAKSTNIIGSATNPAATVTSIVSGSEIVTTITAHKNLTSIKVSSATTSLIGAPKSAVPSSLSSGKSVTVKQSLKTSSGWSVGKTHAYLCAVSTSSGKVTTSIALPNKSLAKTKYGIYTKKSCSASSRVGYITLKSNGTGTYGTAKKELLEMKKKYYIKEVPSSIAPGYTYNTKVYSVSTKGSNSTVVVKATDSFNTLSLTKVSRYPSYTSKYSQFSIQGATYGVFKSYADAQSRSTSRAVATVACNASGYASVTGLATGTYYVSELPSKVTRPISGNLFGNASLGAGLNTPSTCKISSVPMGKFLVDETIHTVKLSNGTAASFTSSENIPVRIKIDKLSTRADIKSIPAFSLAGAVFGVYETRQAAEAAKVVRYGSAAKIDTSGAVAVIYGAADGTSVASKELPLRNYYVKEIQVPKSYSTTGVSYWKIGNTTTTSEVREITVNDFLSSTRCADGILCTPVTSQRVNEPVVTITVGKSTPDLDNNIAKDLYDGMFSLSGAQFAVYRTQADAEADRNRVLFSVDSGAGPSNLITIQGNGQGNRAINVPAATSYWLREVNPPTSKAGMKSAYFTDSTPFEVKMSANAQSNALVGRKTNLLKDIVLEVEKKAYDYDEDKRKLNIAAHPSYRADSLEGALFAVFASSDKANKCPTTSDYSNFDIEQEAYEAGAIAVLKTNANGKCDRLTGLEWSPHGYYVREIKAPTSGCYRLNNEVYNMKYSKEQQGDFCSVGFDITDTEIVNTVSISDVPNYYYIMIRKTNEEPDKFADQSNYPLAGIHFAIYATKEEAEQATKENPGNPLYNIYTERVEHTDESGNVVEVTYDAVTGVTGPGTFWAREFSTGRNDMKNFQDNTTAIPVEASIGGIPDYEHTFITMGKDAKTAKELAATLGGN